MSSTPLAVFLYNRPVHLRQLLVSLLQCARLDECDVYFFCDGAKTPEHEHSVNAARMVAREFAPRLRANILERDQNLGLARSIVAGVTELCNQFGRVIVLEDDLVVHPAFVHFMLSALDRYQDEERVAQISGYMFPVRHADTPDAFFLPYATSWGWAVWDRAWRLFNWLPDISSLDDPDTLYRFNHNGITNHATMLRERIAGLNQSWAILYYWAIFSSQKYVLYPRISLVQNTGFDGSGIHYATKLSISNRLLLTYERWLFGLLSQKAMWSEKSKFTWPDEVDVDKSAFSRISAYRRSRSAGFALYLGNQLSKFWNNKRIR